MTQTSGKTLVQWLVVASLTALLGGAQAVVLCNIDSNQLNSCHASVTGQSPPPPDKICCAVVRQANLPCLCKYKSFLPAMGINPTNALALPGKCGLKTNTTWMLSEVKQVVRIMSRLLQASSKS